MAILNKIIAIMMSALFRFSALSASTQVSATILKRANTKMSFL